MVKQLAAGDHEMHSSCLALRLCVTMSIGAMFRCSQQWINDDTS